MQAWKITADVPEEDAPKYDALANAIEVVFQEAVKFSTDGSPTPVEWLNGLWAGMAEVNNIIVCPNEYPQPRETVRLALLKLCAIMLLFQREL